MLFRKPVGLSAATCPCSFPVPRISSLPYPVSAHCPLFSHLPSKSPPTLQVSAETVYGEDFRLPWAGLISPPPIIAANTNTAVRLYYNY